MYRSFRKQLSNEDIMSFTPPGFKYHIDVQFPRRRLPVCRGCKKISKTRDHCRARDCHSDIAWCETYVCITLDDSCTGPDGKILDRPFVAKTVPPMNNVNFVGDVDPKTPVCASCRDRNYTRNYCRVQKKHKNLPWNTVHVITSLKESAKREQSTLEPIFPDGKRFRKNSGESVHVRNTAKLEKETMSNDDDVTDHKVSDKKPELLEVQDKDLDAKSKETEEVISISDSEEGDDLTELKAMEAAKLDIIPKSRTFLVTVSPKLHRTEWIDADPNAIAQLRTRIEHHLDNNAPDNYNSILNSNENPNMSQFMNNYVTDRGVNKTGSMITPTMNARGVPAYAIGRTRGAQGGAEIPCLNPMIPMNSCNPDFARISNGSNAAHQLGSHGMSSHTYMMHQMQVQRHMTQMNQNQMQADNSYGTNHLVAQPMFAGMMPFNMGANVAGQSSYQEKMLYDHEMRRLREISHAQQVAFERRQRTVTNLPCNTMPRRSDCNPQMTAMGDMTVPEGDVIDRRSDVMVMSNAASNREMSVQSQKAGDIYSGPDHENQGESRYQFASE